jgi:GNAT superfamily N-acetyltransferase
VLTALNRPTTEIEPFHLDRDFADVDALLSSEQWPFVRADIEVSHAQPLAAAFVARKDGHFAGFFLTHAFGNVGYLDMMIVAPPFRGGGIARPLYIQTVRALEDRGVTALVVHTTNDSAGLIRLLGFRRSRSFTLLRREHGAGAPSFTPELLRLDGADRESIVGLDQSVFGRRRDPWISALFAQPNVRFLGIEREKRLRACLCLRPRRDGAFCIDMVSALDADEQRRLVDATLAAQGDRRFECFARAGSALELQLRRNGFEQPLFFRAIGPLVEWRRGRTDGAGNSDRMQCLSWF